MAARLDVRTSACGRRKRNKEQTVTTHRQTGKEKDNRGTHTLEPNTHPQQTPAAKHMLEPKLPIHSLPKLPDKPWWRRQN